jgi:hypothetical protein
MSSALVGYGSDEEDDRKPTAKMSKQEDVNYDDVQVTTFATPCTTFFK